MEILLALLVTLGLGALLGGGDDAVETEPTDGSESDDTVVLSDQNNLFNALGGNDSVDGMGGADTLFGGADDDTLVGGAGDDLLDGGSGDDVLTGGFGFDDMDGGSGDDTLFGDDGKDLLEGGAGNDELNGGSWVDGLFGGDGNDILRGENSSDMVIGDAGDDLVYGGDGADLVLGGAGADSVFGGDGNDTIAGSQLFSRALNSDDYEFIRDSGVPRIDQGDPFSGWGLTGNDVDTSADMLSGGAGDDQIFIGNADIAQGGAGDDEFVLGDWISDGTPAQITDFDGTEDVIVVLIDASGEVPVDVTTAVTDQGVGQVFIDGQLIANVEGRFDTSDGFDADVMTSFYLPQ